MECRPLKITLISAKGLKDVHYVSKMKVYAVATINDDPQTELKTPVDKDGRSNPKWNYPIKMIVEEAAANENRLVIRLLSDGLHGPKDIGQVVVPINEFLDCEEKVVVCDVMLPNGKKKGTLNLHCKIGKKCTVPVAAPPPVTEKGKSAKTPVIAFPAAGSSAVYLPQPPAVYQYTYPPQFACQPQPQPHVYGGYPPHLAQGYGYTGHPTHGGHGYTQAQQPMAGLGQALGGRLFDGLYIVGTLSNALVNFTDMFNGLFDF